MPVACEILLYNGNHCQQQIHYNLDINPIITKRSHQIGIYYIKLDLNFSHISSSVQLE